jgi:hypothetical protein
MGKAPRKSPVKTASLCPCNCGVMLFPGSELGYASLDCLWRLRGENPKEGQVSDVPAPTLYKVRGERANVEQGEDLSTFVTPGQIPSPSPPIVFLSQHARDADTDERLRQHDIFMEYATTEEIMAFQRGMIKAGLMDEPPDNGEDLEPALIPLRPAASVAQVRWARDMIAQFPRKSREQIQRENSISWAQLEHFAKTPLSGLPERATKRAKDQAKAAAAKEAAKPAAKPKSPKKAKGV